MKKYIYLLLISINFVGCHAQHPYKVEIDVTTPVNIESVFDVTPGNFERGMMSRFRDTITLNIDSDSTEISKITKCIDQLGSFAGSKGSFDVRGKITFFYSDSTSTIYFDDFHLCRKGDNELHEISEEYKALIDDICFKRIKKRPYGR